ncbi:MAG: DUF6175 family protein [Spirochaetales bacterium]|uniref:DUF6175 family protein n=1 Tax=Candidatus Thalassospirochaeta sargassi TaxID=3119039 RepID=A0AAJ1IFH4_9SPIO|nr:DUF6175 family protein [Spirochaetales bacterium]
MITGKKMISAVSAAALTALILIFSSCATIEQTPSGGTAEVSGSSEPLFYATGSGETSIQAINNAARNAVRAAAEDLLGGAASDGQQTELEDFFISVKDIEPFIVSGSQETLESRSENGFYYHMGFRINLDVLALRLADADILGGQIDGREGISYRLDDQKRPAVKSAAENKTSTPQPVAEQTQQVPVEELIPEVTAEELSIIRDYLDSLTYMVFYNTDTETDAYLSRTAVLSANRYLEEQGAEYVDLSQIERIKEEQRIVYEEETGEVVSMIQWIAHKLNADVYIELSLNTSSRAEDRKYYGSASVTLNSYNASTAQGLGSSTYQTIPPAFSRVSEEDALSNAVSSAVFNAMDDIVDSVENETAKAASEGFKYNLILMNTEDSKQIRDFEKKLEKRTRNVKRISYSREESVFEVYLIGDISDLEDLVYDTTETIPGLEGILLVMQRGNSIIFDTGM